MDGEEGQQLSGLAQPASDLASGHGDLLRAEQRDVDGGAIARCPRAEVVPRADQVGRRRSALLRSGRGCWLGGACCLGLGRAAGRVLYVQGVTGLAFSFDAGFLLPGLDDAVSFAECGQDRRGVGRTEVEQPQPAEVRVQRNGGGDGAVVPGVAGDAVWPVAEQDGDDARAAAHPQDRLEARAARWVRACDHRRSAGMRQGCFSCLWVSAVAGGDPGAGQHSRFHVVERGAQRAGDGESGLPGRVDTGEQRCRVGRGHEDLGRECAAAWLRMAEDGLGGGGPQADQPGSPAPSGWRISITPRTRTCPPP